MIIAITEVKNKSTTSFSTSNFQIPNYTLHPINLDKANGRGIAVYTHHSIAKSVVQLSSIVKFEETCMLEVRLRRGDRLLFCCCYRSPTATDSSKENNAELNNLLKQICNQKYSHICIVGDFNYRKIDWTSWITECGEESSEAKFIECLRDCYLHQHVEEPTRRRGSDEPSLLDLILTNEEMQVSNVTHHSPLGKSDHDFISFDFHSYLEYTQPKERYQFLKGNYVAMRSEVKKSKWVETFISDSSLKTVEELWTSFKDKLLSLREGFVPKAKSSDKPCWKDKGTFPINKETREVMKIKNKSYQRWKNSTSSTRELLRLKYTKSRNKLKRLLRKAKRNFEKDISDKSKTNPKAFWSYTRRKLKTKCGVSPLLSDPDDKNSLVFDKEQKQMSFKINF